PGPDDPSPPATTPPEATSPGAPGGTRPPAPRQPQAADPAGIPPPDRRDHPWADAPPLTDADAPDDEPIADPLPPCGASVEGRFCGDPLDDHTRAGDIVPAWPMVPAVVPAARDTGATTAGGPALDLLDLTLPWSTLTGAAPAPGTLGRIGP